jgi:hypothetical protein
MSTSQAIYCSRCHGPASRCSHTAFAYQDERYAELERLGPVTTESGEAIRQEALWALAGRHAALLTRSTEFAFSEIEIQHMRDLGRTIERLQQMGPVGPLEPPRFPLDFAVVTQ